MSSHTIAISDLEEALITLSFNVNEIDSKRLA